MSEGGLTKEQVEAMVRDCLAGFMFERGKVDGVLFQKTIDIFDEVEQLEKRVSELERQSRLRRS